MFLWILSPWKFPSKLPWQCKCETSTGARLCRQHLWLHVTTVTVWHDCILLYVCMYGWFTSCLPVCTPNIWQLYGTSSRCWLLFVVQTFRTQVGIGPSSAAIQRHKRDCVSNSSEFFPGNYETYKKANKQRQHIATAARATLSAAPKHSA